MGFLGLVATSALLLATPPLAQAAGGEPDSTLSGLTDDPATATTYSAPDAASLDQLNFYLTLHRQKFYSDTQPNQAYFQPVLTLQDLLLDQYAHQTIQLALTDDLDQVLASLQALRHSMSGYQASAYDFNGLKGTAVLGGGSGVCEHIASAYVELLAAAQPHLQARVILATTQNTTFTVGFRTFDTTPLAGQSGQIQTAAPPPLPAYLDPQLEPITVFAQTRPDHMLVALQPEILGQRVTIFLDPTNPSFWYSDGLYLRHLEQPEIYMNYSPLGQALIDNTAYQAEFDLLAQTKLSRWELFLVKNYLQPPYLTQRLTAIQAQPAWQNSSSLLGLQGFRKIFVQEADHYLARRQALPPVDQTIALQGFN